MSQRLTYRSSSWLRRALAVATALGLVALLSACGGSSGGTTSGSSSSASSQKATVAFLLPENLTYRWENQDAPYFKAALQQLDPNVNVLVDNAGADASTQQSQAEAALANGAKVLIVAPVDSAAAAVIVNDAKQAGVPVIAYDRLITNAPLNYYVSFDGFRVGQLQGQYVAQNTPKGGTVVIINGSQTDNNAVLFHNGYMSVLQPLFNDGTLKKGYESWTPNWDPANAQREMEQALTVLHNNVQAVLSANDGMATTIIAALQAQGLAGKVVVTGQDATVAGLQRILEGTQSMTVYKPLKAEASAAAQITAALLKGENPVTTLASLFNGKTVNNGMVQVPSVLLQPETVTKSNIESTVIKDGFVTQQALCQGIPAADCPTPGY